LSTKVKLKDCNTKADTRLNLDRLETTAEIHYSKSAETQYYKGIRKYKTNKKVIALSEETEDQEWQGRFWDTWHCNHILLQKGNTLIGSCCRRRWCESCSRIKSAERINLFLPTLRQFNDWHFVTLTAPTIKERQLTAEIVKRKKNFKKIVDRLRKQGIKVTALRSLEIEYNEQTDKFHPHFHCLVRGKDVAHLIQNYWLEYHQTASIKAQKIQSVEWQGNDSQDVKNLLELFKYITKGESKKDQEMSPQRAKALVKIYQSVHAKRTFQVFGNIDRADAEISKIETTEVDFLKFEVAQIWEFSMSSKTWVDPNDIEMVDVKRISTEIENEKTKHNGNRNQRKKGICKTETK